MNMKEQLKKADILGLAIIAAALISYSIRSVWSPYLWIAVGLGAALIVASLVTKAGEIRTTLGRRTARFGINSAVSVLFLIGILAFVNYLGAQHIKRFDMTTQKIYSLSDQSAGVVQQIKQDLKIKAFFPGGENPPTRELLDLFKNKNSKISYEFIDPDKQPGVAQQYNVTQYGTFDNPLSGESFRYGTLILEMGGKTERIEKQSDQVREEDITNALMKLVKGEKKTIYFTEGHGEKSIDDAQKTGYSFAKGDLEKENDVVKKLNLISEGKVPDDASVVVIAGPTTEPIGNEMDQIDAYLQKGGSVLILLDPDPAPSLADFLKKWSITVDKDVVVDASGMGRLIGMGPAAPLVTPNGYGQHKITERMSRVMTFFPLVRSVSPAAMPVEGITVDKLIQTNERSWGETNLKGGEASFDEKSDIKGPLSLAVTATKTVGENKKARLVVFGDSDFASNAYYGQVGNGNLFINTINWLTGDESFISIRPKNPKTGVSR